ncbi:MAG TPA: MBL fold metallo-hydrolase [Candidatus Limnocylindrales bacterium]|nr:MBL fold metallo-hydrolase [Candidatus Limnocylindrales bacterium]
MAARARVWFLGTSASVATLERGNAAFAVAAADAQALWLVDAGPGVHQALVSSGLDAMLLEDVFLTHQHGDHLLGLPMLSNALWDRRVTAPVRVHGPASALDALRAVTVAVFPLHDRPFRERVRLHRHAADRDQHERLDAGLVRSAPVSHSVPAVGYRCEIAGVSIVFSGDAAPSPALVRLASGADLLVHDATFSGRPAPVGRPPDHSTAAQAAEIASRAGVRRLALVHLPPEARGRESAIAAEAAAVFRGEVLVPADGDVVEL